MRTQLLSRRQKRDKAFAELLSTEATYVSEMQVLVDVYIDPLEAWVVDMEAKEEHMSGEEEEESPCVTRADCAVIFNNAKQLATFNKQFLGDLQKAHDSPNPMMQGSEDSELPVETTEDAEGEVGEANSVLMSGPSSAWVEPNGGKEHGERWEVKSIEATDGSDPMSSMSGVETSEDMEGGSRRLIGEFLKAAPFFKMYSQYIGNFENARARLMSLCEAKGTFAAFLSACDRQKACHGLRLRDFLIQPVQVCCVEQRLLLLI
ncbi:unnamed protein product [Discosporangium mesarthrocarpum]